MGKEGREEGGGARIALSGVVAAGEGELPRSSTGKEAGKAEEGCCRYRSFEEENEKVTRVRRRFPSFSRLVRR